MSVLNQQPVIVSGMPGRTKNSTASTVEIFDGSEWCLLPALPQSRLFAAACIAPYVSQRVQTPRLRKPLTG